MKEFTFGSLFAGIGGLDLGLERSGMKCKWQVENNDYCIKVLEKHWPDVKRYGDIYEINKNELEKVDLICGGFPCQPFSHAGKRKGTADDRWLWPQFYDTICEVKPRWVMVENVSGLITIDSGRVFSGILRDLAKAGYDAEWFMLRASDMGAPHRRERLFIVAYTQHRGLSQNGEESKISIGEEFGNNGKDRAVANTNCHRWHQDEHGELESVSSNRAQKRQGTMANTNGTRLSNPTCKQFSGILRSQKAPPGSVFGRGMPTERRNWAVEPEVGRVAHGVPARVDRLKGLGNAVVPQIAEYIGRLMLEGNN